MEMIRKLLIPGIILSFLVLSCRSDHPAVTLESLLREMISREQLTCFPSPAFTHRQFSSYNQASVSPEDSGWFANQDMSHFLRVDSIEGRREFVMLDTKGPGVIVRWWMAFYKAQDGIIRVYLDEGTQPVLKGRPDSLLSGNMLGSYPFEASVQEGAERGEAGRDYDHNLYFPIPFSKHCKITYECDSLQMLYDYEGTQVPEGYWNPDVFYNIGYRLYQGDVRLESFSMHEYLQNQDLIKEAGRKLTGDSVVSEELKHAGKMIHPGDSLLIRIPGKACAINYLSVDLNSENLPQAMRSLVLEISFDDHSTVWLPAGEFFGCGYTPAPHKNRMNNSDGMGKMRSFWLMPFRNNCSVILRNYSRQEIGVNCDIGITPYLWKEESMYFGSAWHEYYHINSRDSSNSPFDLNFIRINGKGVYAGDQLTLYNPTWYWWGEGDEKIFVDGEKFPSIFGTGSEDYYGYSFGRTETFSHPFVSQPVGIGNMSSGPVVNTRIRLLDAIPFQSSLDANIELWHWANVRMNYALTTFFYVKLPYQINVVPDPEGVKRRVALSAEDFK